MNLKKLMLLPLICCVSMQQTDAKVIYSPNKTETFAQKIKEKTNKNEHDTINDVALEAFASLFPVTKYWYNYDNDISKYFNNNWEHYYDFEMPGLAAFVPTKNRYNAKVYVGWKYQYYSTDPKTTPPKNTPNETYGDAPLFEYSDYSHTERQLAICALNNANANNKETEITEDSPICLRNEYKTPNIIGAPVGLSDNLRKKTQKQQRTKAAKTLKNNAQQLTNRMFQTEGILCIYTRALPCTSSQDFKENGGMLCVDYYAHLLRACPKINIHVYSNVDDINSLPANLLNNVDCRLIYTTMIKFFKTIIDDTKYLHQKLRYYTSTIKHITSGNIVPTESGWQFTKKEELSKADIDEYILFPTLFPTKINQDIMKAVKSYIQPSTSSKDLATSGEILTTLIRLFLRYKHPDTPSKTFDRLTMHLLAPPTKR